MLQQESSTVVLTRQQLFEKVWTTPMIRLAKDVGLSDVGLRKICHGYKIPTPAAGYWSKKQHGKAGRVPDLPTANDDSSDTIRFEPPTLIDAAELHDEETPKHAEVADALEREKKAPRIEVGELGGKMPKIVANTYRALKDAKPDHFGESFGRVGTSSHSGEFLSVNIGPDSVNRCVRFFNTLVCALESRGYEFNYKDQGYDKGLCLKMLGEELSFHMFERSKRKQHVLTAEERERKKKYPSLEWYKKWEFEPCGQMEFTVAGHGFYCSSATWRDSSRKPLETVINDVIVRMLWIVDELKTKREEKVREPVTSRCQCPTAPSSTRFGR